MNFLKYKYYQPLFIVITVFLFSGCICSKDIAELKKAYALSKMEELANSRYNNKYEIQYNIKGDYAIVYQKNKEFSKPFPDVKYFVYSVYDRSIVIEDSLKAGNIYWNGKYSISASEREQRAESGIKVYTYDLKHSRYEMVN